MPNAQLARKAREVLRRQAPANFIICDLVEKMAYRLNLPLPERVFYASILEPSQNSKRPSTIRRFTPVSQSGASESTAKRQGTRMTRYTAPDDGKRPPQRGENYERLLRAVHRTVHNKLMTVRRAPSRACGVPRSPPPSERYAPKETCRATHVMPMENTARAFSGHMV